MSFFKRFISIYLLLITAVISADDFDSSNLLKDLAIVEEIDRRQNDELPLIYNYLMQGGYFTMPSARMAKAGNLGIGYAYLPPYQIIGVVFQFFNRIEAAGNYTIFNGIKEYNFGHWGFGDDADRIANIKIAVLKKADGFPFLPEISLGWNDFIGSKRFSSFYVAATKEFLDLDFELTAGWGTGRIDGFFLGGAWSPFRKCTNLLKGLSLVLEYDANNYRKRSYEHPKGRDVKSRLNAGIHWNLFDFIQLSASTIRGKDFAAGAQLTYNLGDTDGFFPKVHDPLPYTSPEDREPLGMIRSDKEFSQELIYAFRDQGFDLSSIILQPGKKRQDLLYLKVVNMRYREEDIVRMRIQDILSSLLPENIVNTTVVIEADGIQSQAYQFRTEDLNRYQLGVLSEFEFRVISPLREVPRAPSSYDSEMLYQRRKNIWLYTFRPIFRTYFGSTTGKIKADVGFSTGPEGYLFDQIYYSLMASYTIVSSSEGIGSVDIYNPSQKFNVRSDSILYHQTSSFHLDEAYLQKSWNLGRGCFYRMALGYFETAYAGIAGEFLYFPVHANWAIGFEAASLLKRNYRGLGFQRKIRTFKGFERKYVPYYGLQYFLDFYYQYRPLMMDFKVSLGQFLAWDKGVRIEGGRTFPSGLRVGLWVAYTNGNDKIHRSRYFDKGFSFSLPLDVFMTKSSRTRIGYAMAAWLRDVGARASTGKELYNSLYFERFNSYSTFRSL